MVIAQVITVVREVIPKVDQLATHMQGGFVERLHVGSGRGVEHDHELMVDVATHQYQVITRLEPHVDDQVFQAGEGLWFSLNGGNGVPLILSGHRGQIGISEHHGNL